MQVCLGIYDILLPAGIKGLKKLQILSSWKNNTLLIIWDHFGTLYIKKLQKKLF